MPPSPQGVNDALKALSVLAATVHALTKAHRATPLDYLRALSAACNGADLVADRLRRLRDQQIAAVADQQVPYQRIARAAGMSTSRASRIARATGASPRHVTDSGGEVPTGT